MNFEFTTKETYFAARSAWRAHYADLSAQIRVARRTFNEAQAVYSKADTDRARSTAWLAVEDARSLRRDLITKANEALSTRSAMKEEAARQWEESHRTAEV